MLTKKPLGSHNYSLMTKISIAILSATLLLSHLTIKAQNTDIYKESAWAERDKWQEVPRIIEALSLKSNSHIADVGSHQGYMTVRLAENISASGRIYAVDVDQRKLDKLKGILENLQLEDQVEIIKGDYDNPKLPKEKLDAVLIMDTYHEMDDYKEVLEHVKKSLKPDGRLVLIEPIADEREKWSRKRQEDKHEISIRYACADLKEAGFIILKEENPFLNREEIKGDKLWMIIAVPKS